MGSFPCCPCLRRKGGTEGKGVGATATSPTINTSPDSPGHLQSSPDVPDSPETASLVVESSPLRSHPPNSQLLGHQARPSASISQLRLSSASDRSRSRGSGSPFHTDSYFVARDIWSTAYASLREDQALEPLIEKYESFFNTVLWPEGALARTDSGLSGGVAIVNDSKDTLGETRFRKVASSYVEATKKHAANAGIASAAVQFVQKANEIVSSALAVSPPASVAWAGICLVILPVIINHSEQIAAKQAGFSYVMSRFTWYGEALDLLNREYWKSLHSFHTLHRVIREELISLYKLLIEYQLRAYYTYCRRLKTLSRDVLKLDDWIGMIAAIKDTESRLQELMDLNFDQHLLEKLHVISEDAIRKQRNDILNKFKFPDELPYDVYHAYLDSIEPPEDGTGHGVLTHPSFREWASRDSGVLILAGIPGSGKSVLAKAMLVELPKIRPTAVFSFFFKDNGRGQDAATTAVCRVLDELFGTEPTLVDQVSHRVQHLLPQEVRCNLDMLWDILVESTSQFDPGSITIVLDALDECDLESASKLSAKLDIYLNKPTSATAEAATHPMKFMITTRPFASSHQLFTIQDAVIIKINEDPHCLQHISQDIEQVVSTRFEKFAKQCIRNDELKRELLALVKPKKDRTYLYVKLLFDWLDLRLRDGLPRVPREWITSFKTLPTTVKDAYSRFLGRIHEAHRNDVKLMLQIIVAATRPLTVREINIALNIRDCRAGSSDGLGLQPDDLFRDWILDACKFFLDIYNDHVYFIHQTAKEYLLSSPDDSNPAKPAWLGYFTVADCHSAMAESCTAYLALPFKSRATFRGFPAVSEVPEEKGNDATPSHRWDFGELEFSNYATAHWHNHVNQGQVLVHPFWKCGSPCSNMFIGNIRILQSWDNRLMTFVRFNVASDKLDLDALNQRLLHEDLSIPVPGVHLDVGTPIDTGALEISLDGQGRIVLSNEDGAPLSRIPRVSATEADRTERVASSLKSLALIRTAKALGNYYAYTPLPME